MLSAVTLASCMIATAAATAATIVVAPTGRAGAAGTDAAPLASLAEAASRAKAGDVIRLVGGTYRHAETIRLTASGTAGAPIRIEPADDEMSHPGSPNHELR